MSRKSITGQLTDVRIGEMPAFLRRVAGMKFLSREDFVFPVTTEEGVRLQKISRTARGDGPRPILVLGVMPRSGTNFVRDLLALAPDICADPGQFYEFPLLHCADETQALTERFISYFPRNREVLGQNDILARLAGAWLRELQEEAGDRRILLKCPHMKHLPLAPYIFADCEIVLCVRDGRDVVESGRKTFKGSALKRKSFSQLAHEWRLATEAAYEVAAQHPSTHLIRYEDIITNPGVAVRELVTNLKLDPDTFPYDEVDKMPVRGSSRSTRTDETRWQPESKSAEFNPIGRWSSWSDKQVSQFERIAGETLTRAGYARGGAK